MEHPALLLLLLAGGLYLLWLWLQDRATARAGAPNPAALPGATEAPLVASVIGAAGAFALVAAETWGEYALGIVGEQSRITVVFALYSILGAAVIEEVIFRGWLVVEGRGAAVRWAGIVVASALFALLHPFLWEWSDGELRFQTTRKAVFSTAAAFATSIWFYAVRFGPWNPHRSLLPCFVAHGAKNLAVAGVKAATGFMGAAA